MNRLIAFLLSLIMLTAAVPAEKTDESDIFASGTIWQEDEKYPRYTVFVPEEPTELIVFFTAHSSLYPTGLTSGKKSNTHYNYQEDVVAKLAGDNPDAIVITAMKYGKFDLDEVIVELIEEHEIKKVLFSGWSMGGNDAVTYAAELLNDKENTEDIEVSLLLIDANYTDKLKSHVIEDLGESDVKVFYLSNTIDKLKVRKIKRISKNLETILLRVDVTGKTNTSKHMECRDSAFEDGVYGFVLRGGELAENIEIVKEIE